MIKDFYTLRDIAEQMQIKERTVGRFVSCGELKASKVGGKWIVSAEKLKDFVDASTDSKPSKKREAPTLL